ncbi:MAG TPA: zinc-ribbon domain-containing protein [Bacteroidia bacterium]|jgi:ssDNA-binding Zn-finger/Zn-ribbon topoisomerase 1
MALIFCRECGKQISDQALSCPQCGASHNIQNKKSKNGLFAIIIAILILGLGGYFYFNKENPSSSTETRQDRIDIADRILSKDCAFITNASTEYIKNDFAAAMLTALGNVKCDCIKEKLREKLADDYTLSELLAFEKKPIHEVLEIKNLIEKNNEELRGCFPLVNQIKDAVLKK